MGIEPSVPVRVAPDQPLNYVAVLTQIKLVDESPALG
jgi:hypothetical protein